MMNQPSVQSLEQSARRGDRGARIALANRLMAEHAPGSIDHERGLELLLAAAEEADGAEAQWLLGAYFLQVSSRGQAHAQALHWLERAADAGIAPAVDRLADLLLSGLGGVCSPQRSLALQMRLAEQGFQRAAWEAAYLLGHVAADIGEASGFLRACALGYPPAYYSLGLRFATGSGGVDRDANLGHALLRRAADGGFADASIAADELAPDGDNEVGQHWYRHLKSNLHAAQPLRDLLRPGPVGAFSQAHPLVRQLEAHLVSIGHPALELGADGRARIACERLPAQRPPVPGWKWLSERPRVGVCRDYATREECVHLINKVSAAMRPASDYRRGNSANEDAELRSFSGRGHPIGPLHSDSVTRLLERRLSDMVGWPMEKLEPCSMVCYRPGEEYLPHVDYFTDEQISANQRFRRDFGGQRVATFLVYLRAPEAGGETRYERAEIAIAGERGMGVIHYNVTPDGAQDDMSLHSGLPIRDGEKWLWRSTLREHSLYERAST